MNYHEARVKFQKDYCGARNTKDEVKPEALEQFGHLMQDYTFYKCPNCGKEANEIPNNQTAPQPLFCCGDYERDFNKSNRSLASAEDDRRAMNYLSEQGFTTRHKNYAQREYLVVDSNRKQNQLISDYIEGFDFEDIGTEKFKNLIISGAPGTGKTHLACMVAFEIAKKIRSTERGYVADRVKFTSLLKLSMDIKGSNFEKEKDLISRSQDAKVLIFDDLGKENITKWSGPLLYSILNHRYEEYLPTIITTNCDAKQLAEATDPAIVSRLIENGIIVNMKGVEDYRIKGGK